VKRIMFSFFSLLLLSLPVNAETLRLAVAANFTAVLEQLVTTFDPEQQHDISISSASRRAVHTDHPGGSV